MSSVVSIRGQDDADDELMAVAENVSPLIECEVRQSAGQSPTLITLHLNVSFGCSLFRL